MAATKIIPIQIRHIAVHSNASRQCLAIITCPDAGPKLAYSTPAPGFVKEILSSQFGMEDGRCEIKNIGIRKVYNPSWID
jgi:hypothetical protein